MAWNCQLNSVVREGRLNSMALEAKPELSDTGRAVEPRGTGRENEPCGTWKGQLNQWYVIVSSTARYGKVK